MKFISQGEWFDKDTESTLIEEFPIDAHEPPERWGLFEGIRHGEIDQEVCFFQEFLIED